MRIRLWFALTLLATAVSTTRAADNPLELAYYHLSYYFLNCEKMSLVSLDGSLTRDFDLPEHTFCEPPDWSPDGAYFVAGAMNVNVLNISDGSVHVMAKTENGTMLSPAIWSRDGSYLA